jgi:proteasome lid subunit RPN8/RPN11
MLEIIVQIKRNQLNYFRSKARNTDLEIEALLIGSVVGGTVTVNSMEYTKSYAEQTTASVQWHDEEYQRVKDKAERLGLDIVGDIHSHPNWDAAPSPSDYKALLAIGHSILGICSTNDRKTRVRFWVANSCLCTSIVYV